MYKIAEKEVYNTNAHLTNAINNRHADKGNAKRTKRSLTSRPWPREKRLLKSGGGRCSLGEPSRDWSENLADLGIISSLVLD